MTAGIGARHFHDGSDQALVFEMSVPLPLFDRNADAIAAAHARLAKADHEAAAAAADARREIHDAYQRSVLARTNATNLRATTIPAARAAHRDAEAAFRAGALRRIDVLESERTVFELESDYVTALETAHLADAELERLTAAGLAGERSAR